MTFKHLSRLEVGGGSRLSCCAVAARNVVCPFFLGTFPLIAVRPDLLLAGVGMGGYKLVIFNEVR